MTKREPEMSEKLFLVEWRHRIAGGSDCTYVYATDVKDALERAKPMLDTHKLVPDFLNNYGRFVVTQV